MTWMHLHGRELSSPGCWAWADMSSRVCCPISLFSAEPRWRRGFGLRTSFGAKRGETSAALDVKSLAPACVTRERNTDEILDSRVCRLDASGSEPLRLLLLLPSSW